MDTTIPIPKPIRRLLIVASAFLLVSIALTVGNAVTILAAPPQSPFVPSTVGFEGQLADATGSPVANGNYSITFSLYSVATSGTALWSETQSVAVSDGLYSVQLGSVTAIAASDFDGNRWLGVQVSGDSEMTPRIAIGAVPFALNARQAMGLQGRDVAATAPNDSDVLTWDNTASQWGPAVPGARTFPEINALNSDETPQNFFENYRNGALLSYVSASAIDVSSGEIMINGKMRRNTTAVQINFAGTGDLRNRGLDTGTEQPNTTYYVYAAADDVESVFDVIISASSSAPTGPTSYRQLGWFSTGQNASVEIMDTSLASTAAGGVSRPDYILLRDEKPSGTSGGTFSSGAWRTRDLNTEVVDNGNHASLASNQITLDAGTYYVKVVSPAHRVDRHRLRLQDITNTSTLLLGANIRAYGNVSNHAILVGQITLLSQTVLEIQHRSTITWSTEGFGFQSSWGDIEIYTIIELWKLQ